MNLVGRAEEIQRIMHQINADESKLIALYGRRRVGKTFLVRSLLSGKTCFEITGLYRGDMTDQLHHFMSTLTKYGYYHGSVSHPKTWMEAFDHLGIYIDSLKKRSKKIIFIDELPWFDTRRSKFLMAFTNFWNSYCTKRNDVVVIVCGSAASWMIRKIMNNKGGLHNRVSEKIRLQPFNLYETMEYLRSKGILWSHYDIVQLYMIVGGIPYYLDGIRKGESLAQFVNRSCFTETGQLYDEYEVLYASLFSDSDAHELIVSTLAKIRKGLTRTDLIEKSGISGGGTLTKVLDELIKSGFVRKNLPYGINKNKALYQLKDQFTLFYFKYMKVNNKRKKDDWTKKSSGPSWTSWAGFAFESVCLAHIEQIKSALQLQAIEVEASSWHEVSKESTSGAQIDLLLDRADRIINVCEIKFSRAAYTITKKYAQELRHKMELFAGHKSNKRKVLFLTMVTTFGISDNEYAKELVQSSVVIEDLFRKDV